MSTIYMTGGILPDDEVFDALFDKHVDPVGDTDEEQRWYEAEFKGEDAHTLGRLGIPANWSADARELRGYLRRLIDVGWYENEDENAYSIASSVMSTLGVEWI